MSTGVALPSLLSHFIGCAILLLHYKCRWTWHQQFKPTCHVFSFLDLIMYVDYWWLLPYIQSQFVLFPSHPWRKLVKGTCSQLRDPMEPLQGETPYWEEVLKTPLECILIECLLSGEYLERRNSGQRGHPAQNYPKANGSRYCCPMTCWLERQQFIKFWFNLGMSKVQDFRMRICFYFCW